MASKRSITVHTMDADSATITMMEDATPSAAIKEYTTPSAPITQWRGVLAVFAANRFKGHLRVRAAPADQERSDREGSSRGQNGNAPSPVHGIEYLRVAQTALSQQLNAYGIVLTLLTGIMCVAILQPAGGFDDNGHIRSSLLVACYLSLASISFLLACTGLFAVIAGSASLFRPLFFPEPQNQLGSVLELTSQDPAYDNMSTLESIIGDNLSRVRRLKTYLGFSLGLGMAAYLCGALAILGPVKRNLWMAVGTVVLSSIILLVEAWMTWTGPALPDNTLARLQRIIH